MDTALHDSLTSRVSTDSTEALLQSINDIGPYVSGITLSKPIGIGAFMRYTTVYARKRAYRKFRIPKKTGGFREIHAPKGQLKDILTTLAFIFSTLYVPTKNAMAFTRGRSIVDNAASHNGHNYVLNLDLKNFFTSITAMDVERGLTQLGISPLTAKDLASICTCPVITKGRVHNVVPQGSPASPVLSNICAMKLDARLEGLARRFHLTYTRYADDMTFSSNHSIYREGGEFMTELYQIISECGFTINPKKTRLQKRGTRQEVTGLNVGDHVNVPRRYIKTLRAIIHEIAITEIPLKHDVNVARSKLNFLRMVKGAHNSTYIGLLIKLNMAVKGKHFA